MFFQSDKKNEAHTHQELDKVTQLLERIQPVTRQVYANSAMHVIGAGFDMVKEFILYILGIAIIVFVFIMNQVLPFYVLAEIVNKQAYLDATTNKGDIIMFSYVVKGMIVLIGVLFIVFGLMVRSARLRKSMLQKTAKELRNVEDYLGGIKAGLEKALPKLETPVKDELKVVEPKPFETPGAA